MLVQSLPPSPVVPPVDCPDESIACVVGIGKKTMEDVRRVLHSLQWLTRLVLQHGCQTHGDLTVLPGNIVTRFSTASVRI
jgi:hypothetical protein